MIYVQPESLKPGMILARDLLGAHNEVLLTRGQAYSCSVLAWRHRCKARQSAALISPDWLFTSQSIALSRTCGSTGRLIQNGSRNTR